MENRFQKNRRRHYFINKRFQAKFIIKFCTLIAAGSFLSALIVYLLSKNTLTTSFENCRLTIKTTADFILPTALLTSCIVTIVVGLATIVVALFTSHKIVGPMYRMQKDIEEVGSGNLKVKLNLRRGDELKTLAESLNKMIEIMRSGISSIKDAASGLGSAVEASGKNELKTKLEALKIAISRFSV